MNGTLLEEHAREKAGMPPGWRAFRYEAFPHTVKVPTQYIEIVGAVVPLRTRGPNIGRPNWRRLDKATRRTIVILPAEHDLWIAEWETATGKCSNCTGSGRTISRVSIVDGTEYAQCAKCKGTGNK